MIELFYVLVAWLLNWLLISISIVWIVSIVPTTLINVYEDVDFKLQPYTMTFGAVYYGNITTNTPSISTPLGLIMEPKGNESMSLVSQQQQSSNAISMIQIFGIVYSVLCWVFPWFLTTCLTMGVGVYGWKSLRSIRTIGGHSTIRQKNSNSSTSSLDSSDINNDQNMDCLLYTSPSPRD